MIDRKRLLDDTKKLTARLIDDLRARADQVDEVRQVLTGEFSRAEAAGRTDRAYEEWREDLLAQIAVGWVLGTVFVRFCEDNGLVNTPLLSGPVARRDLARDHLTKWRGANPALGDREWLVEVFDRFAQIDAIAELFGERNPLHLFGPSADGARDILELWWATDDDGQLVHDFTDGTWDTRFLGDLYQDLSEHAKKTYALLQTPEFVEEFILDRTLDPAIETFGLDQTSMIDPTCGSGHFLLGAFDRLLELWRQREPSTPVRVLAQKALDAVAGVDINAFAVSIARFRLLLAALKASDITRLEDALGFTINVAVGDSLLHGTYAQTTLFSDGSDPLDKHRYPNEDGELAAELLQRGRYSCVTGNPPYITVKDPALSNAYRDRYPTCHRQYSLAVPFTELFFALAQRGGSDGEAGYVGMITANSFMKREFGKKLIEDYLASEVELTHIIDTSGAYIPGHGTPTVILLGRDQRPTTRTVRAVLGIRGEPGVPEKPEEGLVWTAITEQIDQPGSETEFVSVEDADQQRYCTHPWSLQGGAAGDVLETLEEAAPTRLSALIESLGRTTVVGEDDAWVLPTERGQRRRGVDVMALPLVIGEAVRDYRIEGTPSALYPYKELAGREVGPENNTVRRVLWPMRTLLASRVVFGKSFVDRGIAWWSHLEHYRDKLAWPLAIAFAEVTTHNHFAFDRGGKLFKQTAPVIKLPEGTSEDEHLGLLGLLNSSTAEFWMNQVFHNKGRPGAEQAGADQPWEHRYQRDGTKLKQFPLPAGRPLDRARLLDELARELSEALPTAVAERAAPTRETLEESRHRVASLRARMVAVQEELDWECYRLYGLIDEDLTLPYEDLPELQLGERAFEHVLARKVHKGEVNDKWHRWHRAELATGPSGDWPDAYQRLVEWRIKLIISDRTLGLLERPQFKRRWNFDDFDTLAQQALRMWLLDRLEAPELWEEPQVTTTARLADRLRSDAEFREVARLYAGQVDADIADVVEKLAVEEAVPYLAAYRLKPSGLRKRKVWEQVWDLQRLEDAIDARTELSADHPDYLDAEGAELAKREQVGKIPVPPKYSSGDFRKTVYWRLRGKLDVPKERFVLLPDTRVGSDESSVIGWAGWDHLQQARALAGHYTSRKEDGAEPDELTALLAGLDELVPWLKQWHNDVDPVYGERMGEFFDSFVETEARSLGLTRDDLRAWEPSTTSRKQRSRR